jgi:hypothetical protein
LATVTSLDLRSRLLKKLDEEKKTLTSAVPQDQQDTRAGAERKPSIDSTDSQSMEAKLRTRAQLRVRLAAEKRRGLD